MIAALTRARPLRCSFCLRPATDLDTLMAGARAHICGDCVAACVQILQAAPAGFAGWDSCDDAALLAGLPIAGATVEATRAVLQMQIGELRRREVSWDRIGKAMGMSRQAAWERFS